MENPNALNRLNYIKFEIIKWYLSSFNKFKWLFSIQTTEYLVSSKFYINIQYCKAYKSSLIIYELNICFRNVSKNIEINIFKTFLRILAVSNFAFHEN